MHKLQVSVSLLTIFTWTKVSWLTSFEVTGKVTWRHQTGSFITGPQRRHTVPFTLGFSYQYHAKQVIQIHAWNRMLTCITAEQRTNLEMVQFDAGAEYVVIHADEVRQVRTNKHTCWVPSMQGRYTQVWILQCVQRILQLSWPYYRQMQIDHYSLSSSEIKHVVKVIWHAGIQCCWSCNLEQPPADIWTKTSITAFKKKLKTFLFTKFYHISVSRLVTAAVRFFCQLLLLLFT